MTGGAKKIYRRWNLRRKIEWIEQRLIRQVLKRTSSRDEARELLGLSYQGLHNKLARYHLIALGHREYPACPTCGHRLKPIAKPKSEGAKPKLEDS